MSKQILEKVMKVEHLLAQIEKRFPTSDNDIEAKAIIMTVLEFLQTKLPKTLIQLDGIRKVKKMVDGNAIFENCTFID